MQRRPAYVYQALDVEEQEIRLLVLGPGQYDDPLLAGLVTISVRRSHRYNTISYVWGDPRKDSNIFIAGARLAVPKNTALALRRMRLYDTTRVVWIDADNIEERGQQVSLMGIIYRRSAGNLVHLTDDQPMAERILQVAHQVDKEARAETNNYKGLDKLIYTEAGVPKCSYRPPRRDLDIEAIWFLTQLPWFRPLWVLQEAVVSPSSMCYVGELPPCPLNLLLRTFRWLQYTSQLTEVPESNLISGFDCILALYELSDHEKGVIALRELTPSFRYLLTAAVVFERSEPRDGVFALLGIPSIQPEGIVPDYMKSTQTILQEMTLWILQRENNLNVLNLINHHEDPVEVCSWMCPYDRQFNDDWDPPMFEMTHSWACDGLEDASCLGDQPFPDIIGLAGLSVDTISSASTVCTKRIFEDDGVFAAWLFNTIVGFRDSFVNDLALALTVGRGSAGRAATEGDMAILTEYLFALSHSIDGSGVWKPGVDLGALRQAAQEACSMEYLSNRKVFTTVSGKIGVGPRIVRPGDVVTVLRGGRVPLIMRPLDGEYQLLGEAYVTYIMQGEAVHDAAVKGVKERIFIVR
ncbi:hypothetical protein LTR56_002518 [Elasticomyces elasticus]|nr:hypothetical protein LTR56_002518 [Elasticomyces elasticus]KAK5750842.1 hypothetical protein LTS12_019053 [Elasticomyces elasticus]